MESTMSKSSRDKIFSRLDATWRSAEASVLPPGPTANIFSRQGRIDRLKELMEAMRTEVHITSEQNWVNELDQLLIKRKLKTLLYAPQTPIGDALVSCWENFADGRPQLIAYEQEVEYIKESIFDVDAAITSAAGAIAETGALILWPSDKEPRLMSIVPPIHIAVLKAEQIFNDLSEAMKTEGWSTRMPTNVILISGPSKTADIEMTLAFGVHGPRELIVILIDD
jgi:L-lactate dehydrogenase complex protein LldG